MPDDDDLIFNRDDLGVILRDLRDLAGLSLRELEARCGVSNSEIAKVERGEQDCRLESFIRIAAGLGLPPGWILDDSLRINFGVFAESIRREPELPALLSELRVSEDSEKAGMVGLLAHFCETACFLLRAGHPLRAAVTLRYPSDLERGRFINFARQLGVKESSVERLSILSGLHRQPLAELRRHGLFPDEYLRRYVEVRELPPAERRGRTIYWPPLTNALGIEKRIRRRENAGEENKFSKDNSILDDVNAVMLNKSDMSATGKSLWESLRKRVVALTNRGGSGAELAMVLKIGPSAVSQLRSGDMKLDAEKTLRLLQWVTAQEAASVKSGGTAPALKKSTPKKPVKK